jgi:hypothetical protein
MSAAHVKIAIRDALVAQLTGLTTTEDRVYGDRLNPLDPENGDFPAIIVYSGPEEIEYVTAPAPRRMRRNLQYLITCWATQESSEDNLVDKLLTMQAEVETAIFQDRNLGGLILDGKITKSFPIMDNEGEFLQGNITIVYMATVNTREGTPGASE